MSGDEKAPSDAKTPIGKFAVFGYPAFTLLLLSRMIGVFGNQMIHVGVGWMIYDMTEDPLNLAFVGLAQFMPALVLALFTGHVADRYDRRRVVAASYTVQGICAGLFVGYLLLDITVIWPLFAILLVLGAARAFYTPASQALLPNLVPGEIFPTAIAWTTSCNKLSTVVGPAIGGLLYLLGPQVTFGTATAFYALAAGMVLSIRVSMQIVSKEPMSWSSIVAGFAYMRIKPVILGAISMDMFAVLMGGLTALLPIYARDILQTGPEGLGLLRGSPAIGGLIAGIILTQFPVTRHAGPILYASVAIFGLATAVFAFSEIFLLSMVALAVLGAADMVSVYIRLTVIQLETPDHMRGRVSAVNGVFITASNELGEFRAGVMAAAFGAVASAAVGGVVVLIVTGLWWRLFPDLRRADRLDGMR